ncbi:MAG: (2Fe-2S)-binding protein [Gammaproteobacteria bacterium]|jgi:bacterioferritin-associated ferredoxin
MIVCICKNVNTRQIQECLERGMTLDDISEEMGLGTGCGRCLDYAGTLVDKEAAFVNAAQPAA